MTEADKRRAKTLGLKERDILESTLMRLNREMTLLENFCIINYTGFVKILKKHDKVCAVGGGVWCVCVCRMHACGPHSLLHPYISLTTYMPLIPPCSCPVPSKTHTPPTRYDAADALPAPAPRAAAQAGADQVLPAPAPRGRQTRGAWPVARLLVGLLLLLVDLFDWWLAYIFRMGWWVMVVASFVVRPSLHPSIRPSVLLLTPPHPKHPTTHPPHPRKQVTTIFADLFCNRDKNQAQAMLLPKRFRTNADYFLLHLVRVFFVFFSSKSMYMCTWACVCWNGVGSS